MNDTVIEIDEETSITFTCEATGDPMPTLMWSRTSKTLSDRVSMGNAVITEDGSVSVKLTIINASREDTGEYVCTANNCVGNDSRSVQSTINGKIDIALLKRIALLLNTFIIMCS